MRQNSFKILIMIFIVLQMAFGSALTAFAADDDNETPVDKNSLVPEIKLINGPVFDIQAGTSNEITMKLRNVSSSGARNLIIQPVIADTANNPFNISFDGGINKFSVLAGGGEKEITLYVTTDKTAESKTYSITLNYTFFNTYGVKFSGTDTLYFKIKNTEGTPQFTIDNFQMTPNEISAGDASIMSATLVNPGPIDMYDVDLTLNNLKPEEISINTGMNSLKINELLAGTRKDFSFHIIANSNMSSGNYPIEFKMTYKDESGKEYEQIQNIYINVGGTGSGKKPALEIRNMAEPNGTYGVNENFSVKFELFNTGDQAAKNVKVSAAGIGEGAAVVPKSSSIQTVKELAPNSAKTIEFIFAATSSSKSQNYPIEFTVEYEDGTKREGVNNIITFKQYAGANISNPEGDKEDDKDEKQSKPKIIVSEYKSDPLIVMAGQEFDLTMTFTNTHTAKTVKNVKMFLTLAEETSSDSQKTGNIFTPVDSSNTFYFDSIPTKGSVNKKLRLFVVPDAQPKTYTLTVNFEYEDEDKNEYTATELLGINVKQVTKLEVDDFALPDNTEAGMPISFSFNYANTGKVTLNNLKIQIAGDVDTQNKNTYVGNLDSGQSDYFEAMFTPMTEGETPVSIIISYDDPSGETIEDRRDFVVNVTAPMSMDPSMMEGMDMGMEGETTKPINWKVVGGIGAAVIVAVIAVVIILKKRKEKKEAAFLAHEDEMDEIEINIDNDEKGKDANEHI